MNLNLKNISISKKFNILAAFITLSLIVIGVYSYDTITKVKINGDYYKKIVLGKDLIADILPPPEYIIESYLVLHQLAIEKDEQTINSLIATSQRLEVEYNQRHKFWVDSLETCDYKNILVEDSYQPALEFYKVQNDSFIPAIRSKNTELADSILKTQLKMSYNRHREAIDKVVKLASIANSNEEKEISNIISTRTILWLSY